MTDSNLLVAILAAVLVGGAVAVALVVIALGRLAALAAARDALQRDVVSLAKELAVVRAQGEDLERDLKQDMQATRAEQRQDLALARGEQAQAAQTLRGEVGDRLTQFTGTTQQQFESLARGQGEALKAFGERLADFATATQRSLAGAAEQQSAHAKSLTDGLVDLTQRNDQKLEAIRSNVEQRLDTMRTENAAKLEQMRATVDEKLQKTLEERLGASFKQVSDRLAQVHEGLGEMRNLATGVGDLKRVLTNVKNRGTWGEKQLGALLAEVLTPGQFAVDVETVPGSGKRVEFALRMPGKPEDPQVWIPVDAKFPTADWEVLQEAVERLDLVEAEVARKKIAAFIRSQAKTIRSNYIAPPHTSDFAVLYLPTESLYAEMMARPGLADDLQREHRVMLAGPSNFLALLNVVQMGFRTVAIQHRSAEVWQLLSAVRTDFGKFGDILSRAKKSLQAAANTIDEARGRTTTIARKLKDVEELPASEASRLLELDLNEQELDTDDSGSLDQPRNEA